MKRTVLKLVTSGVLVSCQMDEPEGGVVIKRTDTAYGVDLTVKHDDNEERRHSYRQINPKCAVGTRWPDCLQESQPGL